MSAEKLARLLMRFTPGRVAWLTFVATVVVVLVLDAVSIMSGVTLIFMLISIPVLPLGHLMEDLKVLPPRVNTAIFVACGALFWGAIAAAGAWVVAWHDARARRTAGPLNGP
jgi:hypothetical protein